MGVRGVAFCLLPFLDWDALLVPSLHPYITIYLIRPSLYKYLSASYHIRHSPSSAQLSTLPPIPLILPLSAPLVLLSPHVHLGYYDA